MQSAPVTSCRQSARHSTFKRHQAVMRQELWQHILLLLKHWGLSVVQWSPTGRVLVAAQPCAV